MFAGRLVLVFAALVIVTPNLMAHDPAGEWCCGEGDCFVIPPEQVKMGGDGYLIFGVEKIPFSEAQPSPDGAFWRCKRPDGTRRCFFAPPPAT